MKLSDRARSPAALGLAAVSAWAGLRLLEPAEALPSPVPVDPADHFSAAEIAAGRQFGRAQRRLGLSRSGVELAILIALVRRNARSLTPAPSAPDTADATEPVDADAPAPSPAWRQALGAGVAAAALTVGTRAARLPLSALMERRSRAAGLSTQDWGAWGEDIAKAVGIEAVLTGALAAGSSAIASRWPRTWWLVATGGTVGVAAAAGTLAPVLLDPVFNNFDPLPDGETRRDVLELAAAAGVSVGEVYSVDASRRTTAVNAYVNGLGPTKRVVLFDTLLAGYSREEIRFIVAHELGHVRHRDVPRLLGFLAISAPAMTLATQQLTEGWAGTLAGPRPVPALSLAMSVAAIPAGLAGAALSRRVERRTDDFGLHLSGAPDGLISSFRKLAIQNRADVTAGRFLRELLATHPPITERIGAALAFQRAGQSS